MTANTEIIVTPHDQYRIMVEKFGDEDPNEYLVTLLGEFIETDDEDWDDLYNIYGYGTEEETNSLNLTLKLLNHNIVGEISRLPSMNENQILWTINPETLPWNKENDNLFFLPPIDDEIDPDMSYPYDISEEPYEHVDNDYPLTISEGLYPGRRYLIRESTIEQGYSWGDLSASINDIIEYDGDEWFLLFDSRANTVKNTITGAPLANNGLVDLGYDGSLVSINDVIVRLGRVITVDYVIEKFAERNIPDITLCKTANGSLRIIHEKGGDIILAYCNRKLKYKAVWHELGFLDFYTYTPVTFNTFPLNTMSQGNEILRWTGLEWTNIFLPEQFELRLREQTLTQE